MARTISTIAGVAALLLPTCTADGLYPKSSAVLRVDGARYYSEIAQSNHTSIIEFYAPWCGHCKNLQPAYEKAAQALAGLAKVGAVNCDEDANKPFCGSMGVQGFPTLKIVRPGKKAGKPFVEDYRGERTAAAIVSAVRDKIVNHVDRLTDDGLEKWLETHAGKPRAILFTDKGTTSALLKALAIDYLSSISVAQARNTQKAVVEKYGITKFPTFVLLPAGSEDPITYDGKLEKPAMSKFLAQAAEPNPDPAPKSGKAKKSAASANQKSASSDASKASKVSSSAKSSAESEASDVPPQSPPTELGGIPLLPVLITDADVRAACLTPTSKSCGLVFQPVSTASTEEKDLQASGVLTALGEVHAKFARGGSLFSIYGVPGAEAVREQLGVGKEDIAFVVVNAKKGWLKRFDGKARGWEKAGLEDWVDSLRMGEGTKEKLAGGVVGSATEEVKKSASSAVDAAADAASSVVDKVKAAASKATEGASSASNVASSAGSPASSVAEKSASSVASAASAAAASAGSGASSATNKAKSSAGSAASAASSAANTAAEKVESGVSSAGSVVSSKASSAASAASSNVESAASAVKSGAESASAKLKEGVKHGEL